MFELPGLSLPTEKKAGGPCPGNDDHILGLMLFLHTVVQILSFVSWGQS